MKKIVVTALLSGVFIIAPALCQEELVLTNWSPPPYWSPHASSGPQLPGTLAEPEDRHATRQALILPSSPLPFVAIAPCREYDSRSTTPLVENTPRTVTLTGAPCGIPAAAQAAAVNITVFNITGAGSNGVFKVSTVSPPTTAWINYPKTETQRANAGVVALTAAGAIVVQVNQGSGFVDFVVDVAGYYAPQGIVNSLNTLIGDVTLAAGTDLTLTPAAQSLTFAANSATANTFNTLVRRDSSGGFSAGTITANLTGNVAGNVTGSATSFTGPLVGDVTGTQGATVVSNIAGSIGVNGVTIPGAAVDLVGGIKVEPSATAEASKFTLTGRNVAGITVPYFVPSGTDPSLPIALDLMVKGSPANSVHGVVWIDLVSSNVSQVEANNYEALTLGKAAAGRIKICASASGTGTVRDIVMQEYGGKIAIGTFNTTPAELLDVQGNVRLTSANNAAATRGQESELLTIAAAATTDTMMDLPANSVIKAVVGRVTTAIPTATSFTVGDPTTAARFAAGVSTAAGTTFVGLTHVDQTGAAGPKQIGTAKLRVTPNLTPGAATGVVRITVFYEAFIAPTN